MATMATASDIVEFYGEPVRQTLKAIVFKMGDEVMGVTGIARLETKMIMFSDIKDELKPFLKTMPVLRTIKTMQKIAGQSKLPVYATADEQFGPDLLERMGFEKVDEGIYVWIN